MPTLTDELLTEARTIRLRKDAVSHFAENVPEDDDAFAAVAREACSDRDEDAFTILLLARILIQKKPVQSDLVRAGAALFADPFLAGLAVLATEGDIPGTIADMIRDGHMSIEREASLLVVGAMWCIRHRDSVFPDALCIQARILARTVGLVIVVEDLLQVFTQLTQSSELERILPEAREKEARLREHMCDQYWSIYFDDPETYWDLMREHDQTSALFAPPTPTIHRATPRIGRNDPCHCGSGKKYKRCCIQKDRDHIPETVEDDEPALPMERLLTPADVSCLRCSKLATMDPQLMQPDVLEAVLLRLSGYREYDILFDILAKTGIDSQLINTLDELIFEAIDNRRPDVARRLLSLPGIPPEVALDIQSQFDVKLALASTAETWLDLVEEHSLASLRQTPENSAAQTELALALLSSDRPALGILLGRAALAGGAGFDAFFLLEQLLLTRDRLNLSPEDPIEQVIDRAEEDRELESADDSEQEEVRGVLRRKEDELRLAKEKLEEARRQLRLNARESEPREEETETEIVAGDSKLVGQLRDQVRELKQQVKTRHTEKQLIRRELEGARQILRENEDKKSKSATEAEDDLQKCEENMLGDSASDRSQPVRIPHFSKQVTDALGKVPRNVARQAIRLSGELGSGEKHAFASVRHLKKERSFLRAKIGRSWRLIFHMDEHDLHFQHLIHRRDLERIVKTLH